MASSIRIAEPAKKKKAEATELIEALQRFARWFGSRDIRVNQYSEGTLLVDFIDTRNNQVIWRAEQAVLLK